MKLVVIQAPAVHSHVLALCGPLHAGRRVWLVDVPRGSGLPPLCPRLAHKACKSYLVTLGRIPGLAPLVKKPTLGQKLIKDGAYCRLFRTPGNKTASIGVL